MLSVVTVGLAGFIFWRENKNGTFGFLKERKTKQREVKNTQATEEVAEDAQSATTEAASEDNTAE
jgi:hypothetical protein